MAKHKQSKRERKFNAKGGVKARLDKGHTIAPKGKVMKRKRRGGSGAGGGGEDQQQQSKRKKNSATVNYSQQQEAQRESEDFVGSANLGDMDIGSFLANLEEDLKQNENEEEDSIISMNDDDSDGSPSEEEEEAKTLSVNNKKKKVSNTKSKNKTSGSDSDSSDSSSSDSDDEEKQPTKKKSTTTTKKTLNRNKDTSNNKKKTKKGSSDSESSDNSSDSDSDSDDEDIEAVEARMKAQMKKLQSQDPEFHEYLQENEQSLLEFGNDDDDHDDDDDDDDGSDDDDDNSDSDDDESEEEDEKPTSKKKKEEKEKEQPPDSDGRSIELTPKMLRNLEHGAFQVHGIKSLKKLIRAYKSACQVAANAGGDEEATTEEGENNNNNKNRQLQEKIFRIESSQVFDRLMVSCLGQCHEAFYFHLLATDEEREAIQNTTASATKQTQKLKMTEEEDTTDGKKKKKEKSKSKRKSKAKEQEMDDKDDGEKKKEDDDDDEQEDRDDVPLDPKILERSPRWMEVKPILNTFLKATQKLITESKEPDLLAIVLKSMSKYIRYLTPFPRMAESLLRKLVGLWSAPLGDASPDYQVVRLNAFLRIRQLALTQPFPFVELCLKKTYLAYARRAKYGGTGSVMTNALPTLTFMGNCCVELYSLDHQSSYQHAFVYIRQLALFLRTVMQKKTTESMQQVYCWQYMHCLKLWVAVLSAACKQARDLGTDNSNFRDDQLMRSLVYPLTEIIMGTVRMAPAPTRHVPLRFHCIRLLQQLAATGEMYIPTTSLLLEILDLKELNSKPKKIKSKGGGATTRGVQLPFLIKLSKDDPLRTAEEQEACMAEIFKLLNREADLYRYSAGFPEYSMQITQRLKKFVKTTKNSRWRAYARGTIDLCKRYTDFAINARSNLTEAPKDVKQLECLRQPKEPSMSERYDAAVEKENKEWTSLIAASTTMETSSSKEASVEKEDNSESESEEEEEKVVKKPKKKTAKGKKPKQPLKPPPAKVDDEVMEIEDTVKEGVDWSDDED